MPQHITTPVNKKTIIRRPAGGNERVISRQHASKAIATRHARAIAATVGACAYGAIGIVDSGLASRVLIAHEAAGSVNVADGTDDGGTAHAADVGLLLRHGDADIGRR